MIRRYPSVFILIFIVSGIVLADQSRVSSWLFLLVCLPLCLGGFIAMNIKSSTAATISFALSLLFFSAFQFAIRYYEIGPNHVATAAGSGKQCHIFGRVSDWPDLKPDRTEISIDIDSIPDHGLTSVTGSILLRVTDTTTALQRGDRVEFYGRIYPVRQRTASTGFDYGRYLNMKGVFGIVYVPTLLDVRVDRRNRYALLTFIDNLRDNIRECLYTNLSPSSAALASGFLIGETRDIPTEVYQRFRDSGTLHLLAVSGSNVALIVLFFIVLLRPLRLPARKRAVILLAVILAFTILSYGEPSVVRAATMASLVIVAGLLQRRHDLNNVIATAAVIILLFDPAQLFDVGFQLSFVIAWGLIFMLPRVTEFFKSVQNRWWYRWLVFPFLVSMVAQVCSMGLIAFYFERIPLISPFANLVVVPLVSIGVIGILVLLMAHLILPVLGMFVGGWLNLLLESTLAVVQVLGSEKIPALRVFDISFWPVLFLYLLLFSIVWSFSVVRIRRWIVISLLVAVNAALLAGLVVSDDSHGKPKVTVFNLPGGVAAVVHRNGGEAGDLILTGVIGRQYPVADRIIRPQLSRLGVEKLNAVFVISADFDAAREIVNLADSCRSERILVRSSLERSFMDARAQMTTSERPCALETLRQVPDSENLSGFSYRWTGRSLILTVDGSGVVFCDRMNPLLVKSSAMTANLSLVVGCPLRSGEADLWQIVNCGYQRVICSKVEQSGRPVAGAAGPAGSLSLPDGLIDLSLAGTLTLNP